MSQAPQAVALYFDTSVLEPIAQQNAGGRIKSLLKRHRAVAFGSIQNLIELFRVQPDAERAQRIRTLLQVARARESDPFLYQDLSALVKQIRAHHPNWINPSPDLTTIRKERNDTRKVWEELKKDPRHRPLGFLRSQTRFRSLVGESKRRQQSRGPTPSPGSLLSAAVPNSWLNAQMKPLFDALPAPEAYWREALGLSYWAGVFEGDQMVSNVRDWLRPHLLVDRIDLEPWMRFWIADLDGTALPRMRVEGLTDYFQVNVDTGNAGDIEHAGYAVGTDYLVTADRAFYESLLMVEAQPDTAIGKPLFIKRSAADIFDEITRELGWRQPERSAERQP